MREPTTRPFLSARWTDLVLINYRVPPDLLVPHLPAGSRLDTPDDAPDLHLLSLVAFHFAGTRVYGRPVPGAQFFPELNLRFYVRRESMRATVFLREFVPAPAVILGARLFYRQPYYRASIRHHVCVAGGNIDVQTRFRYRRHAGTIELHARNEPFIPSPDSQEHFLKEHYWGFDRTRTGRSFRYYVEHPVWRIFPVERFAVTIDPGALLGGVWRAIDWPAALHSVMLAEGSRAVIYEPEPLIEQPSASDSRRWLRLWLDGLGRGRQ